MSIFLTILKILLYVILAVLAIVLVLLFFPASAKILFRRGKLYVDVKYLFLKRRILPGEEEETSLPEEVSDHLEQEEQPEMPKVEQEAPQSAAEEVPAVVEETEEELDPDISEEEVKERPKEEKKSAKVKKTKQKEEKTEENGLAALWKKVRPFVTPATKTLVALFHHIHMENVEIVWNVRGGDAARVGMLSGLAWMVIGDIMKTLGILFGKNLTYKEITVMPCFDPKDGADERFGCEVAVRPIIILLIAGYFGLLFLKEKLFNKE